MRAAALVLALCACGGAATPSWERVELAPDPNPLQPGDALWSPQPVRSRPRAIAVTPDGARAYVALGGREDEPVAEVAVVDLARARVVRRIEVGRSPWAIAVHPSGRFAVVLLRYANRAAVIDVATDRVLSEVPVPFYTEGIAFSPDGRRAFLANRWKDSLLTWDVEVAGGAFRVVRTSYDGLAEWEPAGIPVGTNPRAVVASADRVYVAAVAGLGVTAIDPADGAVVARTHLNAPALDLALLGDHLVVSHTGRGTGHQPAYGFDGDRDGQAGDGTANVMFQDLQNEISVLDARTLEKVRSYTSDTICCRDFRDVDPDHPGRGAALPEPDTWPPSRIDFLPPRDTWTVAGALPEALAILPGPAGPELYVAYSASNEVQGFAMAADGSLAPLQTAGGLYRTSFNPMALAAVPGSRRLLVAERLADTLAILDLDAGPAATPVRVDLSVDPGAAPFPATDAELGEAFNFVTAPFTVDGDQSCAHCHRDGGNLEKSVAMPLQVSFAWGTRQVMAYRGAFDTRPWFFETAMDQGNFFPVINEFDRRENFCCEGLDPLVFSRYPKREECAADPSLAGCSHVLNCREDPPPECASRGYGRETLTRSEFFLEQSREVLGRERAVGDVLVDPQGQPLLLDFDGITRALGLFVLREPRFLPNPNRRTGQDAIARGRTLYHRPDVGCAACHPLPATTTALGLLPPGASLRFTPVISPLRDPDGNDVDRVVPGFLATFPMSVQDEAGVAFGATQLRGIWDRGDAFFHDGRARSLLEAIATPGHPALPAGQRGFNERDGQPNTHGATSQLTAGQLADLRTYLLSL